MLLNVLYWLILVLCFVLGVVVITNNPNWHYYHDGALLALLIIIGLRAFRTEIK